MMGRIPCPFPDKEKEVKVQIKMSLNLRLLLQMEQCNRWNTDGILLMALFVIPSMKES